MEKTLLIRIDGPVQSWPVSDNPADKSCWDMPTKIGVLRHFIAASQGRDPGADISDLLHAITFGVAVVQNGYTVDELVCVGSVNGGKDDCFVSAIEDGVFYVGLACEESLAEKLLGQLQHPKKALSYGCKSFTVSHGELAAYLSDDPLEQALISAVRNDPARRIHVEIEADDAVEVKIQPRIVKT